MALPHWAYQLVLVLALAATVWAAKWLGKSIRLFVSERLRFPVAVLTGGMFGTACGYSVMALVPTSLGKPWVDLDFPLSPFGWMLFAGFFGFAAAIQAGMTASGSTETLGVGN